MPEWLQYLAAFGALILIAPFVAWIALRHGRRIRGGVGLVTILMGFGEAVDPPSQRMIAASIPEEKESPTPGDPPTTG